MDGDPAVENELDTFSVILPLPYRIAFIFVLGLYHLARKREAWPLTPFRSLGMGFEPAVSQLPQDRKSLRAARICSWS